MTYINRQKIICVGEYHTKKVAAKCVKLFILYAFAFIYLVKGINEYNAEENWKCITIMTEMMEFETSMHPIKKLHMIFEFDIGIIALFETLVMTFLFVREIKCKIAITSKGIQGITYWRKEIYIPFEAIQSVYIIKHISCICIETSLKAYKFAYVLNCSEIYNILSGKLEKENFALFNQLNKNENRAISKNSKIWLRLLVIIAVFLISFTFVTSK